MINRNKKLTNNDKFNTRKEINKMKTRIFTICIMVVALAMFAPVAKADFKVTGGGWIITDYGTMATFGLQIKCKGAVCIGNLKYNDRENDIKIHGTEVTTGQYNVIDGYANFIGNCTIQSKDSENLYGTDGIFYLTVSEEKGFAMLIRNENEEVIYFPGEGISDFFDLGGGNINIKVK